MAKKATEKSSSASSPSKTVSNQETVLELSSNERPRRSTRSIVVNREKLYSVKKPTIKPKKKNDKFAVPKKPPTAFFYFLEDFRKDFQEQNPDVKSMREVGKACGEKWKTMTYEEKVKYYDIATEKRAEFASAMADYIKRQESGEVQQIEDDSDSEFDEYA